MWTRSGSQERGGFGDGLCSQVLLKEKKQHVFHVGFGEEALPKEAS